MIRDLWFIAQITWNQLKAISARPPPASHHLGMSASYQQGQGRNPKGRPVHGPCEWCGAALHDMDRCYSKDPENLKKFPTHNWPNGVPPESILRKYHKEFPQNEARNMVKASRQAHMQKQAPPAMLQQSANVAWTAPDIYSAVPASASTSTSAPHLPPLWICMQWPGNGPDVILFRNLKIWPLPSKLCLQGLQMEETRRN
jgi:hypothetical protein